MCVAVDIDLHVNECLQLFLLFNCCIILLYSLHQWFSGLGIGAAMYCGKWVDSICLEMEGSKLTLQVDVV